MNRPVSAYEFIDQYKLNYHEPITAMSAYRMLNFLVNETLHINFKVLTNIRLAHILIVITAMVCNSF